jgi:hypothetical protein
VFTTNPVDRQASQGSLGFLQFGKRAAIIQHDTSSVLYQVARQSHTLPGGSHNDNFLIAPVLHFPFFTCVCLL